VTIRLAPVRHAAAFAQPETQEGVIPLAPQDGLFGLVADPVDVDEGSRLGGIRPVGRGRQSSGPLSDWLFRHG
jgi:hypothetical protein